MTMQLDPETRQRVLLKALGLLMIIVGVSMLSNLWAHRCSIEASPAAFEEVFIAGSPSAATARTCLKKNRICCTGASCVRVSALNDATGVELALSENLTDERSNALAGKPCRRLCRR